MGSFDKSCMSPASFESEQELQTALAENPQLLVAGGATPPILLIPRLTLRDVGAIDLFLLAAESIPVAVATTVGTAGDGRREMVARAIDSIAALARLTAEQLDTAGGGAVERTLRTLAGGNRDEFDRRWTLLGVNLRAARVRFVVAVDERRPSLDRTIRFLSEHSSLDVQCVAVARCRAANGDTYYASTMIPDAAGDPSGPLASKVTQREQAVGLDSVDQSPWSNAIRLVGSPGTYRKQATPAWRASMSSRFVKRAGVWTETHGEEADAAGSPAVNARGGDTSPDDLARVQWDG
jgi:hypothetical protein